ncbi:MAG: ornithine cyclodeaminase [Sphingomonadaceae bacterium]|nr:ornithine cyclodeaminase [Sphingomonadaceae bacterium]
MSTALRVIDYARIRELAKPDAVIAAVRHAFRNHASGAVRQAPVTHLAFDDPPGDCHVKWGHDRAAGIFVVKVATGFYGNPDHGLPSSNGAMLVFSASTGEPIALLEDRGWLTDARTAAAAIIALETAGYQRGEPLGILGAGTQAALVAYWAALMLSPSSIFLWARRAEAADRLVRDLAELNIPAERMSSPATLAQQSLAIVCCTAARAPLLSVHDVRPGSIIVALGADARGKQELDPDIIIGAQRVICDDIEQCIDHGEMQHVGRLPCDIEALGNARLPLKSRPITIIDLTGIAAQDVAIARLCLDAIQERRDAR